MSLTSKTMNNRLVGEAKSSSSGLPFSQIRKPASPQSKMPCVSSIQKPYTLELTSVLRETASFSHPSTLLFQPHKHSWKTTSSQKKHTAPNLLDRCPQGLISPGAHRTRRSLWLSKVSWRFSVVSSLSITVFVKRD